MLSDEELDDWCRCLNLKEPAKKVIERIRASDPSRRVGGGRKNVSGSYPSRKMRATIQFESHRVELPTIYELEHDEDVLEFYDQPPQLKLSYQDKNGKTTGVLYTPDFFVIRTTRAEWVECKTEEELKLLAGSKPNRYSRSEAGRWRCPPGERYAQEFGLNFQIRSDTEIDWVLQRNLIFLEDYFRAKSVIVSKKVTTSVLSLVAESPGIALVELLNGVEAASPDDIHTLIATEQLYVDLYAAPLAEPERCQVFCNHQTARAYTLMVPTQTPTAANSPPVIDLVVGASVCWDGKGLKMLHIGETKIVLRGESEQLIELKKVDFENLVGKGEIIGLRTQIENSISASALERFYKASAEDQAEALRRYRIIEPYLRGQHPENNTVSERTIRDWKAKYRAAQQKYGCGYIGLLSHSCAKGNRQRKLPAETLTLMNKFIASDYETLKQKPMREVYGSLVRACEESGVIAPSYKAFTKEVKRRSGYEQTLKRQGSRAAYQQEPFYLELKRTTPRHGDRPFEIGHIDHTQLDVELVCSHTGRHLGKPWVTFLTDAYSRRILAVYLTFDPPSYRSCMMVLRGCVKRHGRLPQSVVVDNGAEFHSIYFETLLATFECTKKQRPPSKARFGSQLVAGFLKSDPQY